ncbi:MAG TPA: hypothetical protein VNW29_02210 [Candidatus Sulfotelmatobacter sp.]|jgi:hypothetical protein|nr:hypothetical protein [Candidatus Sulfotelmatobacter sp.]
MKNVVLVRIFFIIIASVALIGIIGTYYFYNKYQQSLQNSSIQQANETQDLINKVNKHIVLPSGIPTVGTVTDPQKLTSQKFFANAKKGDKVLIYASERKAILYDPQLDKIIEVGPVNINSGSTIKSDTLSTQNTQLRIAIYYGSAELQTAKQVEALVKSRLTNIAIVTEQKVVQEESTTLVVDYTNGHTDVVKQVASLINGTITQLPTNEVKPNADMLIIIGKNSFKK